jgi:hypothetical protein
VTYITLPPYTNLNEYEYIAELNKAIPYCFGYEQGMEVVHIGSGYELLVNGDVVENIIAAPLLSCAAKMVKGT